MNSLFYSPLDIVSASQGAKCRLKYVIYTPIVSKEHKKAEPKLRSFLEQSIS